MAIDAKPSGLHNDAHLRAGAAEAISSPLGHRAGATRFIRRLQMLGSSVLDIGIGLIFVS